MKNIIFCLTFILVVTGKANSQTKPWIDFNQKGLFVADVCCYYGDQAPNFFPLYHSVPEKPRLKGLGEGYDYDVVNSDVILDRTIFNALQDELQQLTEISHAPVILSKIASSRLFRKTVCKVLEDSGKLTR